MKKMFSDYEHIPQVKKFCDSIRNDGLSDHTIISYVFNLDKFLEFCNVKNAEDLKGINKDSADAYKKHLTDMGRKVGTVNLNLRIIKLFFNFLIDEKLLKDGKKVIDVSPVHRLKGIKPPKDHPAYMTIEQQDLFLANCTNIEDLFLFKLAFYTGLRKEEIVNLKLSDIEGHKVFIEHGKGDKSRTVYLTEDLEKLYSEYLEFREKRNARYINDAEERGEKLVIPDYVFISSKSKNAYEARALLSKFQKVLGRVKLPKDKKSQWHMHTTRHSFAFRFIKQGGSIYTLKELLGHDDIETTIKYYGHIDDATKEKAMRDLK